MGQGNKTFMMLFYIFLVFVFLAGTCQQWESHRASRRLAKAPFTSLGQQVQCRSTIGPGPILQGGTHIVGEIRNSGTARIDSLGLVIVFYNERGSPVDTTTPSLTRPLAPGEVISFSADSDDPKSRGRRYTIALEGIFRSDASPR